MFWNLSKASHLLGVNKVFYLSGDFATLEWSHDNRIIPTATGDILILLDDGRICRLDVDLVDWLKKDLQLHKVPLDDWKKEVHRGYENFPDATNSFMRLRRRDASDRMLITFEDNKTYDIILKEDRD